MLDHKGFDLWADGYDRSVGLSDEADTYPFAGYKNVLGKIFETVLEKEHPCILDIGFGTGTLTSKLYENGCTVYGQDFSEKMIEIASGKMPEAYLYAYDFTMGLAEELKKRKYDFIIATYSLHHLTDEQKVAFLHQLMDVLQENGKILIGDVAFETRAELEECRSAMQDEWDEDEIYFVYDELKKQFDHLTFEKISNCAGILTLKK